MWESLLLDVCFGAVSRMNSETGNLCLGAIPIYERVAEVFFE